jgi:hypothetical protein
VKRRPIFTELVVCDPLHQRYLLLPDTSQTYL